ncbi:hypothetical protein UFOVP37_40 [uncultured Caudovirales phage]|uniref:DUF7936 domain-containing protein n=1 Tax=uncultured Caudovirales phage TaxID=2100421 RepID=A0A6J5KKB6_9CAUD|nr:hypothetical protein UFOVP37_40 [uncultured Caudovirales phage]
MSATITWTVTAMDAYPSDAGQTDVVFNVHWTCSGVQDTYNASVYSTCSVPAPTGGSFTPYSQLTQSQVLGWVWANGVDQTATEAAVQQQIDNQINPPVVTPPLPWSA